MLVLRPDSGDPVEAVMAALQAAERVFGVDLNSKGYKVPRGCSVIYGDGVNLSTMRKVLAAMMEQGFSAEVYLFLHSFLSVWCPANSLVSVLEGHHIRRKFQAQGSAWRVRQIL